MLNFDFLGKSLGIVSPAHFVYDFQQKCFSCYILLTDEILLPRCLYFLRYWAICDVMNFEINLSNPAAFSTWPKNHDKSLNILRTEKAFKVK